MLRPWKLLLKQSCHSPQLLSALYANSQSADCVKILTNENMHFLQEKPENKGSDKEIREEVSHFWRQKRLNRLKVQEMLPEGNGDWRRFIWQVYEVPVPPASGFFP